MDIFGELAKFFFADLHRLVPLLAVVMSFEVPTSPRNSPSGEKRGAGVGLHPPPLAIGAATASFAREAGMLLYCAVQLFEELGCIVGMDERLPLGGIEFVGDYSNNSR